MRFYTTRKINIHNGIGIFLFIKYNIKNKINNIMSVQRAQKNFVISFYKDLNNNNKKKLFIPVGLHDVEENYKFAGHLKQSHLLC